MNISEKLFLDLTTVQSFCDLQSTHTMGKPTEYNAVYLHLSTFYLLWKYSQNLYSFLLHDNLSIIWRQKYYLRIYIYRKESIIRSP